MNTKQLVAFWYTGITVIVILLYFAANNPDYSIWLYISSAIALGSLFIYSFGSHPKANMKAVAGSVLIPIVLCISGLFLANYYFSNSQTTNSSTVENKADITKEDIEIFDATIYPPSNRYGSSLIEGRIRNLSEQSLSSVSLRINIYKDGELVDGTDIFIYYEYDEIPPGGVQSFEEQFYDINYPEDWSWSFTIKDVS